MAVMVGSDEKVKGPTRAKAWTRHPPSFSRCAQPISVGKRAEPDLVGCGGSERKRLFSATIDSKQRGGMFSSYSSFAYSALASFRSHPGSQQIAFVDTETGELHTCVAFHSRFSLVCGIQCQ
jgi:hypothetical protein